MYLKLLSLHSYGPRYRIEYRETLRAGQCGVRIPEATISALIQNGRKTYPAPCKIGIGLLTGLKRSSRVVDHTSPFNAEDKERVELCLHSLSVLSWQFIGLALFLNVPGQKFKYM